MVPKLPQKQDKNGFKWSKNWDDPKNLPPGTIAVKNFFAKQDANKAYVNLVDAQELFLHIKGLADSTKEEKKKFEDALDKRDRHHAQELIKIRSEFEKRLDSYHSRNLAAMRHNVKETTEYLADAKEREQSLFEVVYAQQQMIKALASSYTGPINFTLPKCDGSSPHTTAVFLASFQFYLTATDHPNDTTAIISTFYNSLSGEAKQWVQPVVARPGKFPKFYTDFAYFMSVFRAEFCGDSLPADQMSRDLLFKPAMGRRD